MIFDKVLRTDLKLTLNISIDNFLNFIDKIFNFIAQNYDTYIYIFIPRDSKRNLKNSQYFLFSNSTNK